MRMRDFVKLAGREPVNFQDCPVLGFGNDSRILNSGEVFVAIRTEANDGNRYVADAHEKGAAGYIVSRMPDETHTFQNLFLTRDPVKLIGEAAGRLLMQSSDHRIGITGSAGKTTTKELIAHLLKEMFTVGHSRGNFNNTIGLPLTILSHLNDTVSWYVTELGMSTPGEIRRLITLTRPGTRIWLNVLPAHLGNFDSMEQLRDAKAEILADRDPSDVVIYGADDPMVRTRVEQEPGIRFSFGYSPAADMRILDVRTLALDHAIVQLKYGDEVCSLDSPLPGRYQALNVAAAVLTAIQSGMSFNAACGRVASFSPVSGRGVRIQAGPVTIFDDCYNANPEAVKAVLDMFREVPVGGRRIVILGDMLELGAASEMKHREIGRYLEANPVDSVFFFGSEMARAYEECSDNARYFPTTEEAAIEAVKDIRNGDTVLVKASRGLQGERIVQAIREYFS